MAMALNAIDALKRQYVYLPYPVPKYTCTNIVYHNRCMKSVLEIHYVQHVWNITIGSEMVIKLPIMSAQANATTLDNA